MNILLVTHHWNTNTHHSYYSGYQRLAYYLAKDNHVELITIGKKSETKIESNIVVHYIRAPKKDYFFLKRLIFSYRAKQKSKKLNIDIIHILYTDCGFFFNNKDSFVNTLHLAPGIKKTNSILEKIYLILRFFIIDSTVIKRSKKTVTVSKNLISFAKKYSNEVIYIPHGIDTNFWKNDIMDKINNYYNYDKIVLCVGSHGLDYESFENSVIHFPQYQFIFVGKNYPNVAVNNLIIKSNISDDELKHLYSIADIFYRPITFATANNSILEAMAMGKKIVTLETEGISDYLNEDLAYLSKSKEDYNNLILKALNDNNKKSDAAQKEVRLKFSWEGVAINLTNFYTLIINEKNSSNRS